MTTLLSQNQLAVREEDFRDPNCLVQETARVVTQIEHQRRSAIGAQNIESLAQLVAGGVVKSPRHVDVADAGLNHVSIRHRRLGHGIARNRNYLRLPVAGTLNRDSDEGTARPTNTVS